MSLPFPRPLLLQRQVSQGFCVWAAKITPGSDAGLEERERRKDLLRTREPEQTFIFLSLCEVVVGRENELSS